MEKGAEDARNTTRNTTRERKNSDQHKGRTHNVTRYGIPKNRETRKRPLGKTAEDDREE